jgi:hypothetical protein
MTVGRRALRTWREKLDYLLEEEAKASDAEIRFNLRKSIAEIRRSISELESSRPRITHHVLILPVSLASMVLIIYYSSALVTGRPEAPIAAIDASSTSPPSPLSSPSANKSSSENIAQVLSSRDPSSSADTYHRLKGDSNNAPEVAGKQKTYEVDLLFPSYMAGAEILINGKPAEIMRRTPTTARVRVHGPIIARFTIKKDDLAASLSQSIDGHGPGTTLAFTEFRRP